MSRSRYIQNPDLPKPRAALLMSFLLGDMEMLVVRIDMFNALLTAPIVRTLTLDQESDFVLRTGTPFKASTSHIYHQNLKSDRHSRRDRVNRRKLAYRTVS